MLGFIIGLMIGATLGMVVTALIVAGKNDD